MANYDEFSRSNEFKVKDSKIFLEDIEKYNLSEIIEYWERTDVFLVATYDGLFTTNDNDEDIEFDDICNLIQKHICDDQTVILKEVGHEKLRYVSATFTVITKEKITVLDPFDVCHKLLFDGVYIINELNETYERNYNNCHGITPFNSEAIATKSKILKSAFKEIGGEDKATIEENRVYNDDTSIEVNIDKVKLI